MLAIERDLMELERFTHPVGARSLSLYLDTASSRGSWRTLDALIRAVILPVRSALDGDAPEVRRLDEAVAMARAAVTSMVGLPRAVAVFACPDPRFVRVVPLPDPTVSVAHWSEDLHVKLLLAALDEHERTIVALVDKAHGHVYRIFMGQIEEVGHLDVESQPFEPDRYAQQRSWGGIQGGTVRMGYGEPNDQDLLERMIWLVTQAGGRIEEVSGPAIKSMTKWQGLAVLLRFTPSTERHASAASIEA